MNHPHGQEIGPYRSNAAVVLRVQLAFLAQVNPNAENEWISKSRPATRKREN